MRKKSILSLLHSFSLIQISLVLKVHIHCRRTRERTLNNLSPEHHRSEPLSVLFFLLDQLVACASFSRGAQLSLLRHLTARNRERSESLLLLLVKRLHHQRHKKHYSTQAKASFSYLSCLDREVYVYRRMT